MSIQTKPLPAVNAPTLQQLIITFYSLPLKRVIAYNAIAYDPKVNSAMADAELPLAVSA